MKIIILGSGGVLGVPVWSCDCKVCKKSKIDKRNFRTRPSILVKSKNKTILVDTGYDFRIQMLKHKIKKIDTVLITHAHLDHTASLPELRAGGNLNLKIPKPVFDKLKRTMDIFTYLKTRNPKIKIDVFNPHRVGDISIDSVKVKHEKDYSKEQEPCFGFVFKEKNFKFAYIPDFSKILEPNKVKNLDLFICDGATVETKWGHVGIKGGLEVYKQIKPKLMLFTHIGDSHPPHDELEKFVSKFGNIKIAYDGMIIRS